MTCSSTIPGESSCSARCRVDGGASTPDLELLYVGAMFHDIGLTADYRDSMLRFEVDGANAAEKFLRDRGVRRCGRAQGVALHRAAHHARRS